MNAQTKIAKNVHQRLNEARIKFHQTELKKSGRNTFANYSYFELGDFLVPALQIFDEVGLCGTISFTADTATMVVSNIDDPAQQIEFTSPMGSAALKGCHEVQNIGAVETYQRRYLWVTALEIVEHDGLEATTGKAGVVETDRAIDDAQWAEITQLMQVTRTDAQAFCTAYKIESVKELPASSFERARKQLNAKLSKMAKEEEPA
jgi:hypothetical protein